MMARTVVRKHLSPAVLRPQRHRRGMLFAKSTGSWQEREGFPVGVERKKLGATRRYLRYIAFSRRQTCSLARDEQFSSNPRNRIKDLPIVFRSSFRNTDLEIAFQKAKVRLDFGWLYRIYGVLRIYGKEDFTNHTEKTVLRPDGRCDYRLSSFSLRLCSSLAWIRQLREPSSQYAGLKPFLASDQLLWIQWEQVSRYPLA